MGTNSAICIPLENGECIGILASSDGYPSHMLPLLNKHYSSLEQANQLIHGGNIRVLYENYEPNPDGYHDLNNSQPNVTIVYRRELLKEKENTDNKSDEKFNEEYLKRFDPITFLLKDVKTIEQFRFICHAYKYDVNENVWVEYKF